VTVTAPSGNWTFCAAENQFCAFSGTKQVRYGANNTFFVQTLTGGTQCSNAVFGDPIPGTVKHCDINSTAQISGIGPQTAITCPAGAADIFPGQSIQLIINANVGATTFCLHKGVYPITASIRPKTGNTFVGEYVLDPQGQPQPAILDGSGWTTTERTQAAFRVYDDPNDPNDPTDPVNDVTIRNLVIRNMPQWGIYASPQLDNHWTIDHNEIASSKWGLLFGPNFSITNNYIHHNVGNSSSSLPDDRGGGYLGDLANNTTFDGNEIAYNGKEQKVGRSSNVTFRNNFVHHNVGDGIWYDSNPNAAAVIDNNRVEDNGRNGIFFEASIGATISNNTVKRHTSWDGVFISMSQNAQIYNNTLDGNYGGIDYFLNCDALAGGDDIKNNAAHDNTVVVSTLTDTYASGFFSTFSCTSTQRAPYLSGSKNLTFTHNTYRVPSLSFTRYFFWGGWKDWNQWLLVPQDGGGSSLSQ
jgi:parallel beta-helix repeat protein